MENEEKVEMTELMRVRQLPEIEEHLRSMKVQVEQQVAQAMAMVCTEGTVQAVKNVRADLRKQLDKLEAQRKAVKTAIMTPYDQFEAVYKECVSDLYKRADADLKRKIDETEGAIKQRCEDDLRAYFDELCAAYGLDWLTFEQTGIRVDMTSAKQKAPKKLREQLEKIVVGVRADCDNIANLQDADEVLSEYKRCLNYSEAFATVLMRHRRIEEERAAREAWVAQKEAEAEAVRKVEALAPPTVQPEKLTITFTVTDTRERLIALREWMKANGYQYK